VSSPEIASESLASRVTSKESDQNGSARNAPEFNPSSFNASGFNERGLMVELRSSNIVACLVILAHLAALMGLILNPAFSSIMQLSVGLAIGLSFLISFQRTVLRRFNLRSGSLSIEQINYFGSQWRLLLSDGEWLAVELIDPLFAGDWFLILRFRSPSFQNVKLQNSSFKGNGTGKIAVVIARDCVGADQYRRLLVLLRHRSHELLQGLPE
jgi:hypothetical protein